MAMNSRWADLAGLLMTVTIALFVVIGSLVVVAHVLGWL
jgi:hypothetical protein